MREEDLEPEVRHHDRRVQREDVVEDMVEKNACERAHAASIRRRTIPAATRWSARVSRGFASCPDERHSRSDRTRLKEPPDEGASGPLGRASEAAIRISRSCSTLPLRRTGHCQLTARQSARGLV